jgi:hypothetical protein
MLVHHAPAMVALVFDGTQRTLRLPGEAEALGETSMSLEVPEKKVRISDHPAGTASSRRDARRTRAED